LCASIRAIFFHSFVVRILLGERSLDQEESYCRLSFRGTAVLARYNGDCLRFCSVRKSEKEQWRGVYFSLRATKPSTPSTFATKLSRRMFFWFFVFFFFESVRTRQCQKITLKVHPPWPTSLIFNVTHRSILSVFCRRLKRPKSVLKRDAFLGISADVCKHVMLTFLSLRDLLIIPGVSKRSKHYAEVSLRHVHTIRKDDFIVSLARGTTRQRRKRKLFRACKLASEFCDLQTLEGFQFTQKDVRFRARIIKAFILIYSVAVVSYSCSVGTI